MDASTGSRDQQDKLWSPTAAARSQWVTRHFGPVWEAMLDAARVRNGVRFLDAGCGSGEAAAVAAARGATVFGLDASEAMIALAKQAVPTGTFVQGDLEAMPYPDRHFAGAIACNSVHFAANHVRAVREIARVLEPGGRVAICSMGEYADLHSRRVVFSPTFALLDGPPPANPFALSDPGALEHVVEQAGLRVATNLKILGGINIPSFDDAWGVWRTVGPIAATAQRVGEDRVREAVHAAAVANGVITSSGEIVMRDWFHVVVAEAA
jgi:SAM-dependent methyltransferase